MHVQENLLGVWEFELESKDTNPRRIDDKKIHQLHKSDQKVT